ncbi:hypothetical protein KC929_02200 [Patescibacteria group bacterium]|nr:hypothetical protein [Patescibacteria group bacterium]
MKKIITQINKIRSTKRDLYEELLNIRTLAGNAKSKDDFFDLACHIVFIFQNTSDNEIKSALPYGKSSIYTLLLSDILNNNYFNKCLFDSMKYENTKFLNLRKAQALELKTIYESELDNEEKNKKVSDLKKEHASQMRELNAENEESNIELKQTIRIALHTSFLLISILDDQLLESNIDYVMKQLNSMIRNIQSYQNFEFDRLSILHNLNTISYNRKYEYNKPFASTLTGKIDGKLLFNHLNRSRNLIGSSFIILSQKQTFSRQFKKIAYLSKKNETYKAEKKLGSLAKKIKFIQSSLSDYSKDKPYVDDFVNKAYRDIDQNIIFVLNEMIYPYRKKRTSNLFDKILKMIEESSEINKRVSQYFKENYSVFHADKIENNDWSNKLFIVTIRALSVLEEIKSSNNSEWKIGVFLNEYSSWIEEANQILNKYDLDDDWNELKQFLVEEGTSIEWKSTFYTSTQRPYIDEVTEKEYSKMTLKSIVKPILGMMNVEGGTILVGVVENPTSIVRENVKQNMIDKEGFSLFDVNYEFEKKKKDLDHVKREIQDILFSMTGLTAEKFNNLWEMKILEVNSGIKNISVIKISVKQSEQLIYCKETINNKTFFSLIKRADGRTIEVDISEYLMKENNMFSID